MIRDRQSACRARPEQQPQSRPAAASHCFASNGFLSIDRSSFGRPGLDFLLKSNPVDDEGSAAGLSNGGAIAEQNSLSGIAPMTRLFDGLPQMRTTLASSRT